MPLLRSMLLSFFALAACAQFRMRGEDGAIPLDASMGDAARLDLGASTRDGGDDARGGGLNPFGDTSYDARMVYAACPHGECELDGTGCPVGQRCSPHITSEGELITECENVIIAGDPSDVCDNNQDCRAGLTCVRNRCQVYCCGGSSVTCPTEEQCLLEFRSPSTGENLGFGACTSGSPCDFITQVGCEPSETCYIASSDGMTICAEPSGTLAEGAACTPGRNDPCERNLQCLPTGDGRAFCRRFCDTTLTGQCGRGQACAGIAVEGAPNAGVCVAET